MTAQIAIQQILRSNLERAQSKNPRYSLRSFAKKIGMHPSMLSYLLQGKRIASRKLAERILRTLEVEPQIRSEILELFPTRRPEEAPLRPTRPFPERYGKIETPKLSQIYEWEFFAFLSLMRCEDFVESSEWVAKRLGITEKRALEVVAGLENAALVSRDADGKLARVPDVRTWDDPAEPSAQIALRKFHNQTLDMARKSLEEDPIGRRDFSSMTFAIDPSKLPAAKERIRRFEDEITDFISVGALTQVYRFSVALFPMTKE